MSTELNVKAVSKVSSTPSVKAVPKASEIPVPFTYNPSVDGTDENLLILLHGLGDTHVPFGKLGQQLKLPQTATLALRAPEQIPYLYEQAYQWYPSFDPLGEPIAHPNPSSAITLLLSVLKYLTGENCGWPAKNIHLFGFAQGGSVALETALAWWKAQRSAFLSSASTSSSSTPSISTSRSSSSTEFSNSQPTPLGSITSISGPPLLQYALSAGAACPTPVFLFQRSSSRSAASTSTSSKEVKKYFSSVRDTTFTNPSDATMPRSREEWMPIMEFWSQHLSKRMPEGDGAAGLYEVLS